MGRELNKYGMDKALWELTSRLVEGEDEYEEENNIQNSLVFQALTTDVTGSLGLWGITQE